jgi:hypothetical protein
MRHVSIFLLLFLAGAAGALAGCADPNPTFVFDAAPTAREGGAEGGADAGAAEAGEPEGGTDGPGEAR